MSAALPEQRSYAIVGVDPGVTGAAVAILVTGRTIMRSVSDIAVSPHVADDTYPFGIDLLALRDGFLNMSADLVAIERVSAGPVMSKHATAVLCANAGAYEGLAAGARCVLRWYRPQQWQLTTLRDLDGNPIQGNVKAAAREAVRIRWPDIYKVRALHYKKNQGIVDALLIAEHAANILIREGKV